eukprot:TRINITY_DN22539_c0_g1_i1.p1 TRINITY_DN22539_c0_g1~~TRINITY_DN22539_c0_g1_i1.p1  ORF type:complete len:334 (+),score=58.71 TRINITY_DN22539_c0_g1_i1:23-1024(+)
MTSEPWPAGSYEDFPEGQTLRYVQEAVLGLFTLASILALRLIVKSRMQSSWQASPASTGMRMRRLLAWGLLLASLSRCLSLIVEMTIQDGRFDACLQELSPDQLRWLTDLIQLLPCMAFLSAFSIVVLFWAQLHYTATIVPLPLLDCLVVCINIVSYLMVMTMAASTFWLGAYARLRIYMGCFIGVLDASIAMLLMYYGVIVALELAESARKRQPGKWLTARVVVISALCPLGLLAGAGCSLSSSFWPRSELASPLWSVMSEWLPAVSVLLVLSPATGQVSSGLRSPTDSLDDSTDSEAPLLSDSGIATSRTPAGAPGENWKQLYPPLPSSPA